MNKSNFHQANAYVQSLQQLEFGLDETCAMCEDFRCELKLRSNFVSMYGPLLLLGEGSSSAHSPDTNISHNQPVPVLELNYI